MNSFTVDQAEAFHYTLGCSDCTPKDHTRIEALVVVNNRVLCTAHGAWEAGSHIAAMGLISGMKQKGLKI